MNDRAALLAWLQATDPPGLIVTIPDDRRAGAGDEAIEVRFRGQRYLIRVDEAEA